MSNIRDEIEKLRAQLLDMGKSNNLVNYTAKDDRSVRIGDIDPEALFDRLVMEGESIRITSSKAVKLIAESLKSPVAQSEIDRKLDRLIKQYIENFEDLGYTTVFAALGFMRWKESGKNFQTPIVLIPLRLKRDRSGNVEVSWNGDDVRVSPTFMEKLRELRLTIPNFDTVDDVPSLMEIFAIMKEAAAERDGLSTNKNIVIDVFDFSKSAMYKDIDPSEWEEIPPLVKMILDPKSTPEDVTERHIPSCTYSILEGDSSQMSVVMDVLDGKSVVVEGPPGTGKSQTIANIISECLGKEKTVLFVSEKMAALSVVKKRLDDAHLSQYILELHSDNVNRKNFLREIENSLARDPVYDDVSETDCTRLDRVRNELDAYASALSEPVGDRGLTPYQLIGMNDVANNNIKRRRRTPARIEIKEPHRIDDEDWDEYLNMLRAAAEVVPQVMPIKKNFWKDCDSHNLTPDREHTLRSNLLSISKKMDSLQAAFRDVCRILDIGPPQTIGEMTELDKECRSILESGGMSLRDAMDGDVDGYVRSADETIRIVDDMVAVRNRILTRYKRDILNLDAVSMTDEFERTSKKMFGAKKATNSLVTAFTPFAIGEVREGDVEKDLRDLADYRERVLRLKSMDKGNLFGECWKHADSDPEELRRARDWAASVKRNIGAGRYSDVTALIISRGGEGTMLKEKYRDVVNYMDSIVRSIDVVLEITGLPDSAKFKKDLKEMKPAALRKWIKDINANLDSLHPWSNYCDMMSKFAASPINDLAVKLSSGDIHPLDIVDTFIVGYTGELLADVLRSRPKLRDFSYEMHDMHISDLNEMDTAVLKQNAVRLQKKLMSITEDRILSEDEGMRILKGEFNRGHGQMPVRKIMTFAGTAIQAVKPCFMMSPMSVAQYLNNRDLKFDVVIFDEASQVVPADSLGSLMRGSQAVIMGDSKQLPPTTFFERREEGTTDIATAKDMESLLNLCRASLPVRVLSWHYRSRHDSLMALSNRLFYNDKLMVCPSPSSAPPNMGLQLRYVRTAVYDRGATGTNQKEAKMIAREVWHHYTETPHLSLGVATFNTNQQKAIMDEVEKMFRRHQDARAAMVQNTSEPLIIRNLESIQGDERDVMFVSIGYGYDSSGKLSKSFGALNRAGGERRLNVLMTRAREKCVMFSNFKAMDMGLLENAPEGVVALQSYLEYAELGHTSKLDSPPIRDDLVDAVGAFLATKGVKTATNVGTSGFRIDIAVCSPKDPESYILGICLDGKVYQSMHYTRDRDRTYLGMLKRMGWNTFRLWSMDWYLNQDGAKKRLWNKVSAALAKAGRDESADPKMFETVSEIVETDAPIHIDMLYTRVKQKRKIDSVTSRMKRNIDDAVAAGVSLGRFIRDDDFLMVPGRTVTPRERPKGERWKPEWVHPQEYAKALKECVSIDLSEDEIIRDALIDLGLPNKEPFQIEARKYFGLDQ